MKTTWILCNAQKAEASKFSSLFLKKRKSENTLNDFI